MRHTRDNDGGERVSLRELVLLKDRRIPGFPNVGLSTEGKIKCKQVPADGRRSKLVPAGGRQIGLERLSRERTLGMRDLRWC